MRTTRLATPALALLLLLCHPLPAPSRAPAGARQTPGADVGAFIKEIMAVDVQGDYSQLAMWLPYEFFVASMVAQGTARPMAEQEAAFLLPYLVMFVQSSTDQPDGTSKYQSEQEVRARAVLRLEGGAEVRPLERTPPKLAALMAAIKTMVASEGDAGGANMHIVIFPNTTAQGKTVVNSKQKESLTLVLKAGGGFKETAFNWRTPFDAASSTPPCPRCKAAMSSKWTYCPFDGQKLTP